MHICTNSRADKLVLLKMEEDSKPVKKFTLTSIPGKIIHLAKNIFLNFVLLFVSNKTERRTRFAGHIKTLQYLGKTDTEICKLIRKGQLITAISQHNAKLHLQNQIEREKVEAAEKARAAVEANLQEARAAAEANLQATILASQEVSALDESLEAVGKEFDEGDYAKTRQIISVDSVVTPPTAPKLEASEEVINVEDLPPCPLPTTFNGSPVTDVANDDDTSTDSDVDTVAVDTLKVKETEVETSEKSAIDSSSEEIKDTTHSEPITNKRDSVWRILAGYVNELNGSYHQ